MSDFETDCALVRDNLDAVGRDSFDRIYAEMNRLRKKNASITRLRTRMSRAEAEREELSLKLRRTEAALDLMMAEDTRSDLDHLREQLAATETERERLRGDVQFWLGESRHYHLGRNAAWDELKALREQLTGLMERIRHSEVVVQWGDEIAVRRGELMVADELDALLHPKGSTE